MNHFRKLALGSVAAIFMVAGCSTTPTAQSTTPAADTAAKPAPAVAAPAPASPPAAVAVTAKPAEPAAPTARSATPRHLDGTSDVYTRSVYFDYDQFVIRPDFVKLLKAHADYLGKDKALKIQIQGNADERGSREYNLALGQKRADAIQRVLKAGGVDASRIETISFGEEKPKGKGHDEASWAENRRGDILYSGEY
jgi:peptidoglycan-associated lipoprotein